MKDFILTPLYDRIILKTTLTPLYDRIILKTLHELLYMTGLSLTLYINSFISQNYLKDSKLAPLF